MVMVSGCDGGSSLYAISLDNTNYFQNTTFEQLSIISLAAHDTTISSALFYTLALAVLSQFTPSQQCNIFLSTILTVGYPIAWLALKFNYSAMLTPVIFACLFLTTAWVTLFKDRCPLNSLSYFCLMLYGPVVVWRLGIGGVVLETVTHELGVLLYCVLVKLMPLVATFKAIILLQVDEQFARKLYRVVYRSKCKWVLCDEGIEIMS